MPREKLPSICPDLESCRHRVTKSTYRVRCTSNNVGGYITWYNCIHLSVMIRDRFVKSPKEWQAKEVADKL